MQAEAGASKFINISFEYSYTLRGFELFKLEIILSTFELVKRITYILIKVSWSSYKALSYEKHS